MIQTTKRINAFMANIHNSFSRLIVIACCAVLLMSVVPVLIKWVAATPATIGVVRLAIASLGIALLLGFKLYVGKTRFKPLSRNEYCWLALLGLVFALHWYSYFVSIKLSSASLAAIGVATYGVHLLLLSCWFKKEKISHIDVMALGLSACGIYLASPDANFEQAQLIGFMFAVISGFLYACLPLINQRLGHLTTNTRALGQFGFALIIFLVLMPAADYNLTLRDWWGLIGLGVFSTLIGHTLWLKASTELPNNITAVIYYGYVPLAMILSVIFLDEVLTWQKILGASLIIMANILLVFLHKKKPNA
jgi:drug/metabolite transporter (DMT)-like permease